MATYTLKGTAGQRYGELSPEEQAQVQNIGQTEYQKAFTERSSLADQDLARRAAENQAQEAAQRYGENIFTQRSNALAARQPLFSQAVNDYNKANPNGDYSASFLNQWKDVAGDSLSGLTLVNGVPTPKSAIAQEQANKAGVLSGQMKAVPIGSGTGYVPTGSAGANNLPNIGTNNTANQANQGVPPIAGQMGAVTQPAQPKPAQTPFALTGGNLTVGSKGQNVSQLQTLLGITADGNYGPQTKAAVIAFQQKNGLKPDGIVGPQTQAALAKMGNPNNLTPEQVQQGYSTVPGPYNPVTGQLNAISNTGATSTTNSTTTDTAPTSTSDLEGQYKALLGLSPEEEAAQKELNQLNANATQGQFNVSQQPIAQGFISGQQAAMQEQANIAQMPLQARLALAQQKRQASLDAVKFGLEREDKAKASAYSQSQDAKDEAFRQAQLAETRRNNTLDAQGKGTSSSSSSTLLSGYPPEIQSAAQSILDGKSKLNEYPSAKRLQINEAMSKIYTAEGGNELAQGAYDALTTLETHPGFQGAIGAKGISSLFGAFGKKPIGGTQAAGFIKQLDTLKSNIKLVNIKYLKGTGALSDAEGKTLEDAGTSLDPSLPEADFTKELARVKAVLLKANKVIQSGTGGAGVTPSGIKYTVTQ